MWIKFCLQLLKIKYWFYLIFLSTSIYSICSCSITLLILQYYLISCIGWSGSWTAGCTGFASVTWQQWLCIRYSAFLSPWRYVWIESFHLVSRVFQLPFHFTVQLVGSVNDYPSGCNSNSDLLLSGHFGFRLCMFSHQFIFIELQSSLFKNFLFLEILQSAKICDAVSSFEWYLLPKTERKAYQLLLLYAQKEKILYIASIWPLNMETSLVVSSWMKETVCF